MDQYQLLNCYDQFVKTANVSMHRVMAEYVLDASVIVEICVSGTYADEGLQLLERAGTAGICLYAPNATYYEVAAAQKHQLRVYDSFYLALSQRLNVSLVTTDMRLANGVAGGKLFQVVHVSAAVLP